MSKVQAVTCTPSGSAMEPAEAAAANWLTDRGYGLKNLRSRAVDLALAPLGKRQRKAAAGGR